MTFAALALGGLLAIQSAPAQPVQADQATAVEDVVVVGRQLDEQISSFLEDVTLPEANMRVSRWNKGICVSVVNMRNDAAQFIVDRVSEVAMGVGLEPGEPGCKANVTIIAAGNADSVAREMVDRYGHILRPDVADSTRNRAALRRFAETDAAVRWWHVSVLMDSHSGHAAVRMPKDDLAIVEGNYSRLRTELRKDIASAIVILDINQLHNLNLSQIADYAAMVTLSQIDLDADFSGYNSILAMEANPSISGLTDWDRAYLSALYSASLSQAQKSRQIQEIADLMQHRELREPQPAD